MSGGSAKNARYVKEFPSSRRSLLMASRRQITSHHTFGHGPHLGALGHGALLDEREGVLFRQAMTIHEHALGAVDDLARLQLLLESLHLIGQRAQLLEAGDGELDGR